MVVQAHQCTGNATRGRTSVTAHTLLHTAGRAATPTLACAGLPSPSGKNASMFMPRCSRPAWESAAVNTRKAWPWSTGRAARQTVEVSGKPVMAVSR